MVNIRDPKTYIEHFLKISNKQKKIVPLRMKPAQRKFHDRVEAARSEGRAVRIIILKARQEGFSTVTEAEMFHASATRPLVQTLIVAHRDDSTSNLFRMNKLFYDLLSPALQPLRKNSNAKELTFENPTRDPEEKRRNPGLMSRIRCVTAGPGVGRSDTLTNVHCSEFAFWKGDPQEILDGIMQAVPDDPGTMVVIESTANGYNAFKTLWDDAVAGRNGFEPLFFAWFDEPEYRRPVEPGTEWTAEELELQAAYGLDGEQLSWRRWCIKSQCSGSVAKFHQEYPSCPEEAFLFSGTPFFDNEKLLLLKAAAPAPEAAGAFAYPEPAQEGGPPVGWEWREDARTGYIQVWQKPQRGHPYVIGGDTAGEGSDRYIAWVIDNATGEQAAELAFSKGDILYARQLYCLGLWYNTALIAVEVNYNTYCSRKLEEWHYPNLYVREISEDEFTHRPSKRFGFRTDRVTRPLILTELQTIMAETGRWVRSTETLDEMMHFVYNEDRRPEAEEGAHDDRVMAAAICYHCRDQQTRTVKLGVTGKRVQWRPDQYEDYKNADAEGKRYLLEKWGNPF